MGYKDVSDMKGKTFADKTKAELVAINSGPNPNKTKGQQIRRFRERNPDITALMEAYGSRDQLAVMDKYIHDNEKFVELYKAAKTPVAKAKIWGQYQGFQLKIFELMFGTKASNLNVTVKADSARSMEETWKKVRAEQK